MDDRDVELVVLAEVVGAEHDVLGLQGEERREPLLDADHLLGVLRARVGGELLEAGVDVEEGEGVHHKVPVRRAAVGRAHQSLDWVAAI